MVAGAEEMMMSVTHNGPWRQGVGEVAAVAELQKA
jgi:hypothetical protein